MQHHYSLILTILFASLALVELGSVNEFPPTNSYATQKDGAAYAGGFLRLTTGQEGQGSRLIYNTPQDLGTAFTVTVSYLANGCKEGSGGADG
jgi:hypothetical protein